MEISLLKNVNIECLPPFVLIKKSHSIIIAELNLSRILECRFLVEITFALISRLYMGHFKNGIEQTNIQAKWSSLVHGEWMIIVFKNEYKN